MPVHPGVFAEDAVTVSVGHRKLEREPSTSRGCSPSRFVGDVYAGIRTFLPAGHIAEPVRNPVAQRGAIRA